MAPRIIIGTASPGLPSIFFQDPSAPDFQTRKALRALYWKLEQDGILEEVAFVYKKFQNGHVTFALDASELAPYAKVMRNYQIPCVKDAIRLLFTEPIYPCIYSGAISPDFPMATYREIDGIVSRSVECFMMQALDTTDALKIAEIQREEGRRAAVIAMFRSIAWKESRKSFYRI